MYCGRKLSRKYKIIHLIRDTRSVPPGRMTDRIRCVDTCACRMIISNYLYTIYKEYIEEAFDKVEDTAKRMAAKKMLKLLGVQTYFPDPDKIPDITKAIEFFKSHLRNKKGKIIDAFDTMQGNDGRSGMSL